MKTETWLNDSVSDDIMFDQFQVLFRRDRVGDSHGGILVYVKNEIPCKRRVDLELLNIECVWIEINIKNSKKLIGTFYRLPNASPIILTDIENSVGLAVDTRITDVIITGDLNLNMLNQPTRNKITDICQQYNLNQIISEPTHFTENSSSVIDLILVNNLRSIELSGVGEPFLLQHVRYHCPVFVILTFKKEKLVNITREIWLYNQGDFNLLRQQVSNYDWNSVKSDDVNCYAQNFTNTVLNLAKQCIPNKTFIVRPHDLPWMNGSIKKKIRKRNRLYKKYKRNKTVQHFEKYKRAKKDVIQCLRKSKKEYTESSAEKLKMPNLSPSDYWKTLKSFIKPANNTKFPPINHDDVFIADSKQKAKLLDDFLLDNLN